MLHGGMSHDISNHEVVLTANQLPSCVFVRCTYLTSFKVMNRVTVLLEYLTITMKKFAGIVC